MPAAVVWFRSDLRLHDNPALFEAVRNGYDVVPVYIWSPEEHGKWSPGAASRLWLHHSLLALDSDLRKRGSGLIIRQGSSHEQLLDICRHVDAVAVFYNRVYEPALQRRDAIVYAALKRAGVAVHDSCASVLFEPWEITTQGGTPYKVYTPFANQLRSRLEEVGEPLYAPKRLANPAKKVQGVRVDELKLLPQISWDTGITGEWKIGEAAARSRLRKIENTIIEGYARNRDNPEMDGTTRLSPHLHFGEISPREILQAIQRIDPVIRRGQGARTLIGELLWREFATHLLYHFPATPDKPLRPEFAKFPWHRSEKQLQLWQRGQTGYPIVDAGMRQLWETGWMHNRVRLIVASFLVKDLLISWQQGARWFWDTLVDADLANNSLNWQWSAGSGADAAPFFRIFNPVAQGKKFDPHGDYVRQYVPELRGLCDRYIHTPWLADAAALRSASVRPGVDYPMPVVDHAEARDAALLAFQTIKSRRIK